MKSLYFLIGLLNMAGTICWINLLLNGVLGYIPIFFIVLCGYTTYSAFKKLF